MITSTATLVEVVHPWINRPALEWTLSRLVVEPVTESISGHAARFTLMKETGRGSYQTPDTYVVPRNPSSVKTVTVPATFFLNGWVHLVIQDMLADPEWADILTDEDKRALNPTDKPAKPPVR